ncbi:MULTISPECIES: pentapeptide repeat-containing protein [unclassified Nostoc]|uniref:pentapeptide repeat-containing protein n=1 Tax=unclassified Nostoc TaxID=2593658 RepID=UPI002AD21F7D|nr:pentapeptide repeat-containing protein [Nostoc sp. DedQUE03]MDZ7976447.1 pentapeptide repeat-containing protein [Nostoc sp. DedQUE03]MDZ8042770.1 pentapeptide repeat-containing protein [Nostoc sp. DedQUE02]
MQIPVWLTKRRLIGGCTFLFVAGAIASIIYAPDWTGFGSDSTTNTERDSTGKVIKTIEVQQSGKTLWDWLSVLGVPLSLAVLGYWLQQQQQNRDDEQAKFEKERAEQQVKLEKEIAESNRLEELLQDYFDRLSTLLVDKNLIAIAIRINQINFHQENHQEIPVDNFENNSVNEQAELLSAAVDVIRARTLSILRRFGEDGEHKASVIRFLIEAEVISKLNLDLSDANLSDVNLRDADLRGASLKGVRFLRANLRDANLRDADLRSARFVVANLRGANLQDTNLKGTMLVNTDLSDVTNWTENQLNSARLCQTILPEGSKLNPDRDCKDMGIDLNEFD